MTWLSLAIVLTAAPAQTPERLPTPMPSVIRLPNVSSVAQAPQEPLPKQEQLPNPKGGAAILPPAPPLPQHPISPYAPIDYEHPMAIAGFYDKPLPLAPPPLITQPYRHPEKTDPWLARNAGEPRWSHVQRGWGIFKTRFDPAQSAGYVPPGTIR